MSCQLPKLSCQRRLASSEGRRGNLDESRSWHDNFNKLSWVLVCLIVSTSSCVSVYKKISSQPKIDNILAKVNQRNSQLHQLRSSLDIYAHGFLGNFFHEQADLVVKDPNRIWWSMRSFIGSPSFVLASNGKLITIFDFSEGGARYHRMSIDDEDGFNLFDFPFHPTLLAEVFLTKIPIERMGQLEFFESSDRIKLSGTLPNGWRCASEMTGDALPIATVLINEAKNISYRVTFSDVENIEGIAFPRLHVLQANGSTKSVKLDIHFTDVRLNGDPVKEDIFYLKPH